jgi:hypothetical protein
VRVSRPELVRVVKCHVNARLQDVCVEVWHEGFRGHGRELRPAMLAERNLSTPCQATDVIYVASEDMLTWERLRLLSPKIILVSNRFHAVTVPDSMEAGCLVTMRGLSWVTLLGLPNVRYRRPRSNPESLTRSEASSVETLKLLRIPH